MSCGIPHVDGIPIQPGIALMAKNEGAEPVTASGQAYARHVPQRETDVVLPHTGARLHVPQGAAILCCVEYTH